MLVKLLLSGRGVIKPRTLAKNVVIPASIPLKNLRAGQVRHYAATTAVDSVDAQNLHELAATIRSHYVKPHIIFNKYQKLRKDKFENTSEEEMIQIFMDLMRHTVNIHDIHDRVLQVQRLFGDLKQKFNERYGVSMFKYFYSKLPASLELQEYQSPFTGPSPLLDVYAFVLNTYHECKYPEQIFQLVEEMKQETSKFVKYPPPPTPPPAAEPTVEPKQEGQSDVKPEEQQATETTEQDGETPSLQSSAEQNVTTATPEASPAVEAQDSESKPSEATTEQSAASDNSAQPSDEAKTETTDASDPSQTTNAEHPKEQPKLLSQQNLAEEEDLTPEEKEKINRQLFFFKKQLEQLLNEPKPKPKVKKDTSSSGGKVPSKQGAIVIQEGPRQEIAIPVFTDSKIYAYIIEACSLMSRVEDIVDLLKFLERHAIQLDIVTYNAIIGALVHHGLTEESQKYYQQMKQANIAPNEETCVHMLKTYESAEDRGFEEVFNAFVESKTQDGVEYVPSVEVYEALLSCICHVTRDMEKANALTKEMQKNGIKLTLDHYSMLLDCCFLNKDKSGAEMILYILTQNPGEFKVTIEVMNKLLKILAEAGDLNGVQRLRAKIAAMHLKENVESHNAVLLCYLNTNSFERAKQHLMRMRELGIRPNIISHSLMFKELHDRVWKPYLDQMKDNPKKGLFADTLDKLMKSKIMKESAAYDMEDDAEGTEAAGESTPFSSEGMNLQTPTEKEASKEVDYEAAFFKQIKSEVSHKALVKEASDIVSGAQFDELKFISTLLDKLEKI